ncbi:MAG: fumarylacetoacetate hydrolase family protein [Acidobacteriota bacterium]|nr:fumarylacetoacetate hydrolase family protein [Acidobacteriota bacterium]
MKLCTFEVHTKLGRHRRLGAVIEGGIVDLNFAYAAYLSGHGERRPWKVADVLLPANMLEFLQAGAMPRAAQALEAAGEPGVNGETLLYAPGDVRLLAPLPNPASVRDFYAFESHVKKGFEKRGEPMPREWYEIPVYYKSGHQNIIGTDQDVHWPSFTQKFDYELELAAVIGERGRDISAVDANKYIAGYTVMNDFSARDIQRQEMRVRLGPAKGKDWATAIGPYLVTPDEIGDPYNLAMTARVNGEVWSEGNSRSIYWTFAQMIEFLTRDDEIVPGDLIGSGTVGTGCGLELDRWVKRGDLMELEIEKIGRLRNRVV